MSQRVTLGASSASPAATMRIAVSSSSSGRLFSANPLAPAPQRLEDVLVQVEGREDEYPGHEPGPFGSNLFGRLDAVRHRHPDVHDDDVRRELDRLPSVGRLADDLQVVFGVDERRERGAQQRLIVDDEDPWSSHRTFDRDLGDHPEAAIGERLGDKPAAERADPLAHSDDPVARARVGLLPVAARRTPGRTAVVGDVEGPRCATGPSPGTRPT